MAQFRTNASKLSMAVETSLGEVDGTPANNTWISVVRNTISAFGATVGRIVRNPVSDDRQNRKGTIATLTSSIGFEIDATFSNLARFLPFTMFNLGNRFQVLDLPANAVDAANNEFDLPTAITSQQRATLTEGALLYVSGCDVPANNGLKSIDAQPAANATSIGVSQNLAAETSTNILLSAVGSRISASSAASWAYTQASNIGVFTLANHGFAGEGLEPGNIIRIGSYDDQGNVQNAFGANDEVQGYAIVRTVTSGTVICDVVSAGLKANGPAKNAEIDILFGQGITNVDVADAVERSLQFEVQFTPNTGDAKFDYVMGNFINTLAFNLPLGNKSVMNVACLGLDTDADVDVGDRRSVADQYVDPDHTSAFNTAQNLAELQMMTLDNQSLAEFFKSVNITIGNNVSPETALANLQAVFMNYGNFTVGLETQAIYDGGIASKTIRDNDSVKFTAVMENNDGIIAIHIPSMDLDNGGKEFPEGASVLQNMSGSAHGDNFFNKSVFVSFIRVPR